jgi:Phage portal protein, SPP1 Gp6-like
MGIAFYPPSYRAAASDLTIAISPLGLVELADEEFEVHGPRLNRYANNWAWFLGHHWAYRREIGEPQLVFNWVRAFSDFLVNFSFGHGINFTSPEATQAIIPYLLKEVWEVHNNKHAVINEIGQQGSVSGDVFAKVAYEQPYVDAAGVPHEGRIRILPLNPAFCFPEWHPHDRSRMIRFKLKYKFWGTAVDGTRQVMTYVELLTENEIEEYINDELIDRRPNQLGEIPIAYTQNYAVSSSPWGLSDIAEIIPLNREYNEKATEISDIINYHVAPVTVITGAKASNLEKGPRKIWAIGSDKAKVTNLELETNFTGPLGYMELLKQAMHEMTGVPATALGTLQPISNTSGVALALQYQPLMLKHERKKTQYIPFFQRVNELVIRTAFLFAPELTVYNPYLSSYQIRPDQAAQLDPSSPVSYRTTVEWPSPMPMDTLIKINEVQAKMAMNLESRRGALRDLGEPFPDQKLREIFEEILEDTKEQGALDLIRSQMAAFNMMATGMTPDGQPLMGQDEEGNPVPAQPPVDPALAREVQQLAYGIMPPQILDFGTDDTA